MNGLYVAALALSKGIESMSAAQKLAQDDIETANLVNAILGKLADFNGNMKEIELFLQRYLDSHAAGTKEREKMTTGGTMALVELSGMLDHLKADDAKIDGVQTQMSQYVQRAKDLGAAIAAKGQEVADLSDAFMHPPQWAYLGLPAYLAVQGIRIGVASRDLSNLQDQLEAVNEKLTHATTIFKDAQRDQTSLLAVKTGSMNTEGSGLSSTANSAIDQMMQMMKMSFMFLSAIEDKSKQI